jgi:drug/metabolite transporter (DMT)-like permease
MHSSKKTISPLVGTMLLILTTAIWGSQSLAGRAVGLSVGSFTQNVIRCAVTALILLPFVRIPKINPGDWKWFIFRAIGNVIATSGFFFAVNRLPVGTALFGLYAGIVTSGTLIGMAVFKEKITMIKIISLLCAVLGIFLIYGTSFGVTMSVPFIIVIIGGFGGAIWSTFTKFISSSYDLKFIVAIDNIFSMLCAFSLALVTKEQMIAPAGIPVLAVIGLLYYGLTQSITGQLIAKGFAVVDAQVGSVILIMEIVWGMLFAWIFLHESIGGLALFGGFLIILAATLPSIVTIASKRRLFNAT